MLGLAMIAFRFATPAEFGLRGARKILRSFLLTASMEKASGSKLSIQSRIFS